MQIQCKLRLKQRQIKNTWENSPYTGFQSVVWMNFTLQENSPFRESHEKTRERRRECEGPSLARSLAAHRQDEQTLCKSNTELLTTTSSPNRVI